MEKNMKVATSTGWVPVAMIPASEFKMVRDALSVLTEAVSNGQGFAQALMNARIVLSLTAETLSQPNE